MLRPKVCTSFSSPKFRGCPQEPLCFEPVFRQEAQCSKSSRFCCTVWEPAASQAHSPGSQRRGQVRQERSFLNLHAQLPLLPDPELSVNHLHRWIWVSNVSIPCPAARHLLPRARPSLLQSDSLCGWWCFPHLLSESPLETRGGWGDLPRITQQVRDGAAPWLYLGWGLWGWLSNCHPAPQRLASRSHSREE